MPSYKPIVVAGALAVIALGPCKAAWASPTFPAELENKLGLSGQPKCTICHATDQGGIGTAVKPFGVSMRELGTVRGNPASLLHAIDAAEAQKLDSDSDGVPDIDELRAGTDPNDGSTLPIPRTGCGIARSGELATETAAIAPLLLAALFFARRSSLEAGRAHRVPRPFEREKRGPC
jgi:hypothetical protein